LVAGEVHVLKCCKKSWVELLLRDVLLGRNHQTVVPGRRHGRKLLSGGGVGLVSLEEGLTFLELLFELLEIVGRHGDGGGGREGGGLGF
jgi:hypothetical protein